MAKRIQMLKLEFFDHENTSMFVSNQQELINIDKTLQKFWEIENIHPNQQYFSTIDSEIKKKQEHHF